MDTADVAVVGAGVIGCAIAYELACQGAKVAIFEQEAIGSGSSAHATGSLSLLGTEFPPGPSFAMAVEAYKIFVDLVPQLENETGMDLLYQRAPALRLALEEEEESLIKEAMVWQRPLRPMEWIDGDSVLRMEPRLSPNIRGAAYEPESAQLDSYRLTLALAQGAELHGAEVNQRKVVSLESSGGHVTGVRHTGGILSCPAVVLALGPWSEDAAKWLRFPVPVRPMKGERLLLQFDGEPLHLLISSPKRGHMISRLDGYLSVGSTGGRDYDEREAFLGVEFDRQPTESAKNELIQRALDVFPALEEASVVQQLAGSRPLSADRLPLIGPVPGMDGVTLATGHGTKGIHLAPITANMVAGYVLQGQPDVPFDLAPFLPSRFAGETDLNFEAASKLVDE
jgi:glycine oxidase